MATETTSFITVLNKYILYSEALSQYHKLDEEDQKIVAPYIQQLKQRWQEELHLVQLKLNVRLHKGCSQVSSEEKQF